MCTLLSCPYALLINTFTAWWKDKEDSVLSWAGISLMFSKIPEDIWVAGPSHMNTGEAAHYDIQREGVHLPLFVGILVGRRSDLNALKSRAAFDDLGVKDVYRSKEASALIQRNDQRQSLFNYLDPCLFILTVYQNLCRYGGMRMWMPVWKISIWR